MASNTNRAINTTPTTQKPTDGPSSVDRALARAKRVPANISTRTQRIIHRAWCMEKGCQIACMGSTRPVTTSPLMVMTRRVVRHADRLSHHWTPCPNRLSRHLIPSPPGGAHAASTRTQLLCHYTVPWRFAFGISFASLPRDTLSSDNIAMA